MTRLKQQIKRWVPRTVLDRMKQSQIVVSVHDSIAPTAKRWVLRNATHDEIYGDDYFAMIDETTNRSAAIITDSILEKFHPSSLIDIGCGTGSLIAHLREQGIEIHGVEHAVSALDYCQKRGLPVTDIDLGDASQNTQILGSFDLAVSLEVGHQLPPSISDAYLRFIGLQARSVLFSSDSGADDRNPLNARPPQYWIDKFKALNFQFDTELSQELKDTWETRGTAPWFSRFPMVFHQAL